MNIYKRIFCVLLVFVYLCVAFLPLHTVHATENEVYQDYGIATLNLDEEDYDGSSVSVREVFYNGNNGHALIAPNTVFLQDELVKTLVTKNISNFSSSNYNEMRIGLNYVNNGRMFSKGNNLHFSISGLENSISVNGSDNYSLTPSAVYEVVCYFKDMSGSYKTITTNDFTFTRNNSDYTFTLDFNIEIPCDTYDLLVGYRYNYANYTGVGSYLPSTVTSADTVSLYSGFYFSKIVFDETDGTKGLLASIIQLVTNIKDGVINLPSKIASSIKGFFDNVVNSITNLGNFLLDGIKGLFVPSEEDITVMKDKWDNLLSDRFGALYQTTELISDYASAFTNQEKNTIIMPSVTILLAGSDFVFGGWEVQVVPEGFSVVFDTLKLIISIVCTVWFVNGLKNRFERLVGGVNNI